MRYINDSIMDAIDASVATTNSEVIDSKMCKKLSLQCVATGTAAGTIKVQFSNDILAPVNWSDIASATIAVSGAGVTQLAPIDVCYQWMRCVYTKSSGTGTISLIAHLIGDF